ncbi:ankyrin repeat-containing domain protein, partial [Pestalotiopsis sp. NC0098]
DTNGNNALHLATQEQYPDIVDCLIHSDSNLKSIFEINAQNNSGWTPLHLAARSGRLITVQILLRNGASISSVNSSEETALHISAYQGHKYVVNELIDH